MATASRTLYLSFFVGAATLLSGCNLDLREYANRLEAEERMLNRVEALSPTAFAAMPTAGSATFEGTGNFYIDRDRSTTGDGLFIIGDATITADFQEGTVTGDVTNFAGATNIKLVGANEVNVSDIESMDVSGRIDLGLNESMIGDDDGTRTSRPNDWFADYQGTLVADGETYALDGEIDGQFYGTRVDNPNTDFPIKAIAGAEELYSGSTATRQSDGTVFDLGLAIIAEN